MKLLVQESHDPYFNIASEEYLLKNFNEEFVILYSNSPSIIVGKHQNTMAEINHWFVKKNGIPVVRRISGGGTVYHDLGNVNFSFILNVESDNLINFPRYTKPIIDFLNSLGADARLGSKNEIIINGLKVSGNAEHVYKRRVLHHGTLLFATNLENLELSIKSNVSNYHDKTVRSNKAATGNIKNLIPKKMSKGTFTNLLKKHLTSWFNITEVYVLNSKDKKSIKSLVDSKYVEDEWNFGYNSNYEYRTKIQGCSVALKIKDGIISEIQHHGPYTSNDKIKMITTKLIGKQHSLESIQNTLSAIPIIDLDVDALI